MTQFADSVQEILDAEALSNWQSFRAEARFQRVCAVCGAAGDFQAHHVVYEQVLSTKGFRKPDRYDTRNALRLCNRLGPDCHNAHHNRVVTIKTTLLKDANVAYAFIVLGPFAADWLRRYYDDSEPDPRISELESRYDHPALHPVRGRPPRRRSASPP